MKRHPNNPILTRQDIPPITPELVDVTSVFNPGAVHWQGEDRLLLRVQTRGRETRLLWADRMDGSNEKWNVRPQLVSLRGIERLPVRAYHVYDPRLTVLEGNLYGVFAVDTDVGCRLAIGICRDGHHFELISFDPDGDRRNGVLFPERVGGRFLRLQRPNAQTLAGGPRSGSQIELVESDDLVTWRVVGPVMDGRWRYWDELIGSGPPPIRTHAGWLHLYHGVATHFASVNIYQVGAVLLDDSNPARVIARSRLNLLEPREPYELTGQVPNVVFPGGMLVDSCDASGVATPYSVLRVYYGAADTCVGMAMTSVKELLDACEPVTS